MLDANDLLLEQSNVSKIQHESCFEDISMLTTVSFINTLGYVNKVSASTVNLYQI